MSKRGQVTIFLVGGILILLLATMLFFLVSTFTTSELEDIENVPVQTIPVQIFIERCLSNTAEDAIQYNFLKGGIYRPSFISIYEGSRIPYYFYLGEDVHPTEEQIVQDLGEYIQNNFLECLDFTVFPDKIIERSGSPLVSVTAQETRILVELQYTIQVREGNQERRLDHFEASLNVPLREVLGVVSQRINAQMLEPNEIMLTDLADGSWDQGYTFETIYQDDDVIFILRFPDIKVNSELLQIQYASKYNWFNELEKEVDLEPLGKHRIKQGQAFKIHPNFSGENVTLTTDSDLAIITAEDRIEIPSNALGTNYILVTAANGNASDTELLIIEVI
jgi:hypothetical protein